MAGGSMGDVMAELHREGHIKAEDYVAVCWLLEDMRASHGTSAGIVGEVCEKVQTSLRERMCPPGGGDPDAFDRMSRVLDRLRAHERDLLRVLVVQRELPRGGLSDMGRLRSAYRTNKTTRAFAVGMIASLASSIAQLYEVNATIRP
jgi:hypothetical protein